MPQGKDDPVQRAFLWIACAALVAMMLAVTADVALRALFGAPIQGAYDVVSFALLIMAMFGMGPVVARRGEIVVDLLDALLPAPAIRALSLIAAGLGAATFLFCGWAMLQPAQDAWEWGDASLELGIPKWTLWAAAFAGMLGIFWGYVLQARADLARPARAPDEEGGL